MKNDSKVSQVKVSQRQPERERQIFSFKAIQVVWLLFGILMGMIAMRIGLKLIGANPENLIVTMIYGFTDLFLFPFAGLVNSPTTGKIVFELSSLFAILIYGLIAWGLGKVIWLIFYRPNGPVVGITETKTSEHHFTDIP